MSSAAGYKRKTATFCELGSQASTARHHNHRPTARWLQKYITDRFLSRRRYDNHTIPSPTSYQQARRSSLNLLAERFDISVEHARFGDQYRSGHLTIILVAGNHMHQPAITFLRIRVIRTRCPFSCHGLEKITRSPSITGQCDLAAVSQSRHYRTL